MELVLVTQMYTTYRQPSHPGSFNGFRSKLWHLKNWLNHSVHPVEYWKALKNLLSGTYTPVSV